VFTGLVEDVGTVIRADLRSDALVIAVRPVAMPLTDLAIGESIAHDGVCLTLTKIERDAYVVLAGAETLRRTTLGEVATGSRLNLERAVRLADRLGGHLVAGHVDGVGEIAGRRDLGSILRVYVALSSPERLIRSCAKIWPSYYRNAGRMEAVTWSPENTTLRIHDFPAMSHHHCRLMEGWMISTMQTIGFQPSNDARETRCPSRGDAWHEFSCRWTRGTK